MILDVITAGLIVIPMGIGMMRGFLYIAVRFLGWIGALAAGIFGMPVLRDLLADSFLARWIHDTLTERFGSAGDPMGGLPPVLGNVLEQTVQNTMDTVINALEGLILTMISFLAIVILTRLVLTLVIRPLTKSRKKSPISFLNKFAGTVLGGVEGLLLAFLFLAALIPVMKMSSPETAAAIADGLNYSYLAGPLYDGNMLMAIFG